MKQILKLRLDKSDVARIIAIAGDMKPEQWVERKIILELMRAEIREVAIIEGLKITGPAVTANPTPTKQDITSSQTLLHAARKEVQHRKQLEVVPLTIEIIDSAIADLKTCKDLFSDELYKELMNQYREKKYSIEF